MDNVKCLDCNVKSSAVQYLTDAQLHQLGNKSVEVHFESGEVIFKQNALSSNIIYLKNGLVKLYMKGPSREQILKIVRAPAYLGIPTTVGDKVNHYSAMALDHTEACFIDLSTFRELIHANGNFAWEIILTLCRYELGQFHRCINLTQKQLNGKLAGTLLFLANDIYESNSFHLHLTRLELADIIGTTRESISRILQTFVEDNLINVSGKTITLLNKEKLKIISQTG